MSVVCSFYFSVFLRAHGGYEEAVVGIQRSEEVFPAYIIRTYFEAQTALEAFCSRILLQMMPVIISMVFFVFMFSRRPSEIVASTFCSARAGSLQVSASVYTLYPARNCVQLFLL